MRIEKSARQNKERIEKMTKVNAMVQSAVLPAIAMGALLTPEVVRLAQLW